MMSFSTSQVIDRSGDRESKGKPTNSFPDRRAAGSAAASCGKWCRPAAKAARRRCYVRANGACSRIKWGPGPDDKTEILVKGVTVNAKQAVKKAGGKSPISPRASPATVSKRAIRRSYRRSRPKPNFWCRLRLRAISKRASGASLSCGRADNGLYRAAAASGAGQAAWTRMLMTAALREHLKPGPMRTIVHPG